MCTVIVRRAVLKDAEVHLLGLQMPVRVDAVSYPVSGRRLYIWYIR